MPANESCIRQAAAGEDSQGYHAGGLRAISIFSANSIKSTIYGGDVHGGSGLVHVPGAATLSADCRTIHATAVSCNDCLKESPGCAVHGMDEQHGISPGSEMRELAKMGGRDGDALALMRIFWRRRTVRHRGPARWQQFAAHAGHGLLMVWLQPDRRAYSNAPDIRSCTGQDPVRMGGRDLRRWPRVDAEGRDDGHSDGATVALHVPPPSASFILGIATRRIYSWRR